MMMRLVLSSLRVRLSDLSHYRFTISLTSEVIHMNQNADRDYQNFIEAFEVSVSFPFINFLIRNYESRALLIIIV